MSSLAVTIPHRKSVGKGEEGAKEESAGVQKVEV